MVPRVAMDTVELLRVGYYYLALRAMVDVGGDGGQLQRPSVSGSGNGGDQGGAASGQGGGQEPSGHGAGPTGRGWGSTLCCGGQDQALDEETENLVSQLLSKDLPILEHESVDEDAQGPDATMKDELMLLARGSEMWARELVKYLQVVRKEMQEQRAVRKENWVNGGSLITFSWYFLSFVTSGR
jgi:hypothetical protein